MLSSSSSNFKFERLQALKLIIEHCYPRFSSDILLSSIIIIIIIIKHRRRWTWTLYSSTLELSCVGWISLRYLTRSRNIQIRFCKKFALALHTCRESWKGYKIVFSVRSYMNRGGIETFKRTQCNILLYQSCQLYVYLDAWVRSGHPSTARPCRIRTREGTF